MIKEVGTTPDLRLSRLRRLINTKKTIRIIESHNGLSGLIAENTIVEVDGEKREFDGMWASSLTDSTVKGKPDIEAVDITARMQNINDLLEVTTKPIIFDGDTGGKTEHFAFTVRTLERLGVSAVIIEDKVGLKKNSLFGNEVEQEQDTIENFSIKIKKGKDSQVTHDFMIIARIESLILGAGVEDALNRAKAYIQAGADGIMIHSKQENSDEIFEFCDSYKEFQHRVPLIAVPTSYSSTYESELAEKGVDVIIYANHLLRSAYPAMLKTAQSILIHQRSEEANQEYCMSINEILTLIPGTQ